MLTYFQLLTAIRGVRLKNKRDEKSLANLLKREGEQIPRLTEQTRARVERNKATLRALDSEMAALDHAEADLHTSSLTTNDPSEEL